MKTLLSVVLFFLIINNITAQTLNWAWAKSGGGISNDYSNAVCADANGNVYVTGTFQGSTITIGSYTLQNTATGSLDIFIAKYDASGNVLWAKSGGGTNYDYAYGVCTDIKGNVYITGYFRSPSIAFGVFTLINKDTTGSSTDIFVSKYDSTGNVLWAKSAGGGAWELGYGICSDANSNVYITGRFGSNSVVFGNDTLHKRDQYDIFIAKYDSSGNVLWGRCAGGTNTNAIESGQGICADASGNVYVTGLFYANVIFANDTITGIYSDSFFVAKYDSNGNYIWAKATFATGGSIGIGVTAGSEGSIYVTGYFEWSVAFRDTLANYGTYSIFTAKYDSNGNAIWGRTPGGTGNDFGTGICINANGNIFVTGYFASSFLNFGGIPVINTNVGYDDIYVAEYDASGNALWAKGAGGQDYDYGMGICSTGENVYVAGYFGSYSLNFGSATITNEGSYDVFLAKLSPYLTGIEENNSTEWYIFPNPSKGQFIIYGSSFKVGNIITIYNVMGEKLYSRYIKNNSNNQISIDESLDRGIYLIQLSDGKNSFTKKIVVE